MSCSYFLNPRVQLLHTHVFTRHGMNIYKVDFKWLKSRCGYLLRRRMLILRIMFRWEQKHCARWHIVNVRTHFCNIIRFCTKSEVGRALPRSQNDSFVGCTCHLFTNENSSFSPSNASATLSKNNCVVMAIKWEQWYRIETVFHTIFMLSPC